MARVERLTPSMVRVFLTGADIAALPELTCTDHYIKILFPPAAADYRWPFDPEAVKETHPAGLWPVTRTYTIRALNRDRSEMAVDFVVHGADGLAGAWAGAASPGDQLGFFGPGGAYRPDETADSHLLVGDEAALPAIAVTLEQLPAAARAEVYVEVEGPEHHQVLPRPEGTTVTWVQRGPGQPYGEALAAAVRARPLPGGRLQAFVHGNADMVRDLRRFLLLDCRLDREQVSISGYWRTGHTEDSWQATKRQFNQQMEQEEAQSAPA